MIDYTKTSEIGNIMKVKKKEIFDAEQWFPGKKIPGVQDRK